MKKQLLLLMFSFLVASWGYSQATINCFPASGDYNTGTTNGTDFAETSLIRTTVLTEVGWARFDISAIPAGATIQSIEVNMYVVLDDYAYWQAVAIDTDPLTSTASDLFTEITAGAGLTYYFQQSGSNFPEPNWWIADLGPDAVTDLQENLDNLDGWFGVGIYEYEGSGNFSITCDGWNETNQPFIVVTYLVPGAPLPAYNPNPADESFNIEPDTDLTWDFGADTETYDLYFGTDFPPSTKVVENETSGVSGLYSPGTLEFQTTYYWQVVSKNSVAELETPGPIWTFTTKCDIWPVPIYEDFTNVAPPEIPYCWFKYVDSFSIWAAVQTNNWGGIEGSNCLYMDNSDDVNAILIFATPQIEGGVAGKYANFFSYGYAPLSVGTMSDPTDATTYSEYTSLALTNTFQEFEVFFTDYTGTDEYIAFKHSGTDWYQSIYIDNLLIDVAPSCPKPSDLYFTSSTLTTATVGWNENGSATTWNLEYGYKGFTPTGTSMMSTDLNPTEITGLESGTMYEFYVQADCGGGDLSYWVGPFEFATQCEAFDVLIAENFDLTTIPELPVCWTAIEESISSYAYVNTVDYNAYSQLNCLYLYNSNDSDPTLLFVSPPLNDPISELWLNFWAWGYSPEVSIGTMSNPADASTYTEFTTLALSNTYMNYQELQVFFDTYSGSDQHIAFKGVFEFTYEGIYIDDVIIDHPPSCPKPEDLYVMNQTTSSATIGWTEMGSATMWNIEYDTAGFTPTGVGNIVADSNPFDLTGLDPATEYEYYVQADCGGDVSYWVGPLFFKTTCVATPVPYFEGFEDALIPEPPVCINVENVNEDNNYWYTANDNAYQGLQVLRVNYNWQEAMDDWFFSAPLELIGDSTYIVQFYYTCNSSSYIEKLEVKWGEFPSSMAMTSNAIFKDTLINYAFTYHEGIGYFTPPSDGVYYVGWHGYSIPNQYNIYVDNILIDVAPSCLKPADLYASATTTASATLQWTENGDATYWNIEYGPEGFTPTGVPNATADSNPYELMGLDPSTVYDVYIQADCGSGDVSWWEGPATFATLCEPFTVTVFENFDNVTSPEIPLCWSDIEESFSSWAVVETIEWTSYSAPNSIQFYNSDDQFAEMLLISPALVDPINTLWINFFSATDTWGIAGGLIIGTIANPLDASTFTPVDTIYYTVGGVFEEYEVFFTNYVGSDQFIAIKGMFSGTYQYCYIDNITIDHPPTCPKPSDLYANGSTTNSIMLGWLENGTATQWNIEYGDPGFTQTGVPNATAFSNPFELTGLDDGTLYEYYVQADCGGGDQSYWVGPYIFQTLCFPATLPYEEGFENVVIPMAPPCIVVENTNMDNRFWESSMMNPNNGNYHMSVGWNGNLPMNDWFFSAPLQLLGGQTYNVIFYYTNSSDWYSENLEILWGTEPNSDAMVNGPIWEDLGFQYNGVYQEAITSFSPDTNGLYFVGWHGISNANQDFIYVDDIFIEWDNSLVVLAIATPDEVCQGESSQLNGSAVGGSGSYSYSWTSDPAGFTSTLPDPIVTPTQTTDYILEVNDGMVSIYDTVTITMIPLPGTPGTPSGLTYICATWGNTTYNTSGATNATSYNWVLDPEEAGEISGNATSVTVIWDDAFLGVANLSVAGINNYCEGSYSNDLAITLYLPDVTLATFDTACVGWSAFALTGGLPAGGVYSGTGVVDGMFDPAVAGVGTHTITYTYEDVAFCENSAEQDIVVDVCTGISQPNGMSIGVIPNPSNGLFKVFIKSNITEKVNIKVMNNQGIKVYEELNVELTDRYETEVDLQQYAKGLYYLYIITNDATYIEKIIVK